MQKKEQCNIIYYKENLADTTFSKIIKLSQCQNGRAELQLKRSKRKVFAYTVGVTVGVTN